MRQVAFKQFLHLILSLFLLSVQVQAQNTGCLIGGMADDLTASNDGSLKTFFDEGSTNVKAWTAMYKAEEVAERTKIPSLAKVSDHLAVNTNKTADALAAEIKSLGGYSGWLSARSNRIKGVFGIDDALAGKLNQLVDIERLMAKSDIVTSINQLGANKADFLNDLTRSHIDFKPNLSDKLLEITSEDIRVWDIVRQTDGGFPNKRLGFDFISSKRGLDATEIAADLAVTSSRTRLANELAADGFTESSRSVKRSPQVSVKNKDKLSNDTQLNPVADYTLTRNGTTYSKLTGETWWEFFDRLKNSGAFNVFESHHVLPVDLFRRESFKKWYELVGKNHYSMNGENTLENLIMLEKKTSGVGVHSRHDAYTDRIGDYIDARWNSIKSANPSLTDAQIANRIDDDIINLSDKIKKSLRDNSVKGDVELSTYWDQVDFNQLIN